MDTGLDPNFRNYRHGKYPSFERPRVIGAFSVDKGHNYHHSSQLLKHLVLPEGKFRLDLNEGYDEYVPCDIIGGEMLEYKYIKSDFEKLYDSKKRRLRVDFVSWRGFLKEVFCAPFASYSFDGSWVIQATRYRGTIYLRQVLNESNIEVEEQKNDYVMKCEYYGKKFETLVLSDEPGKKPDKTTSDVFCESFNLAMISKFGKFKLLILAETDGVEKEFPEGTPLNKIAFTEVKTSFKTETKYQEANFKKKLLGWWCQCYLAGIENVYYGARSRNGIVEEINCLNVMSIPHKCQEYWSGSIVMQFGLDFLTMVDKLMKDIDCPYSVFEFEYDVKQYRKITYEKHISTERTEVSFLPEDFISLFK